MFVKIPIFVCITGVPEFKDDTTEEVLDNVINASKIFKLPDLERICVNLKNEEEFLNPSIGTYLNDETGKRMKQLFFNTPRLADITFRVEGKNRKIHVLRMLGY